MNSSGGFPQTIATYSLTSVFNLFKKCESMVTDKDNMIHTALGFAKTLPETE